MLRLSAFVLLATLVFAVTTLASDAYFRAGPHPDFTLVGVVVDTPARYAGLLALIGVTNCIKVVVAEMGEPVLVFNVYNPDKTLITDFTRTQLLWYANLMFFVSNTRRVFEVLVTVTQFDIAVFSVVVEPGYRKLRMNASSSSTFSCIVTATGRP